MADTTTATVSGDVPAENPSVDPTKVTPAEHKDAVKAVSGDFAPVPPEQQEGVVVVTRDLPSEQKRDEKLDKEMGDAAAPFTASLGAEERDQAFVRTLANGKTEAVLVDAPAMPVFPPDDGGYNPEKRTHAGPGATKVPSAVGKNRTTSSDVPEGWKEEHRVDSSKETADA